MLTRLFYQILDILFPYSFEVEDLANLPKAETVPIQNMWGIFSYKSETVKKMIKHLKKLPDRQLAEYFAEMLLQKISETISIDEKYLLIPIPITHKRKKQRGFNQTELIAKSLVQKNINLVLKKHLLEKIKETPKQAKIKNRDARLQSQKQSFALAGEVSPDSKIIIIDDVITTGATCLDARRCFLEAGINPENIFCFAIAH